MSRITDKLATLNSLRAIAGKAPLASWKNSEAELDQRIADLTPAQNLVKIPQEPDRSEVLAAMQKAEATSTVPVTVLPADPAIAKPAKRKAIIEKIAADSVKADTPTTVIDAKAAARKLRKDVAKQGLAKTKQAVKAKAKVTTSSPSEFSALLASLNLDPKKARAKLRNAGMSAPYTDITAIKKVLTTDGRKKAK